MGFDLELTAKIICVGAAIIGVPFAVLVWKVASAVTRMTVSVEKMTVSIQDLAGDQKDVRMEIAAVSRSVDQKFAQQTDVNAATNLRLSHVEFLTQSHQNPYVLRKVPGTE